ncbi:MAG TPA: hypothetical protein EYG95_00560 [Campylobacterales bacterium]|nr:hypothetical protein [Campylobacterales bacterium]
MANTLVSQSVIPSKKQLGGAKPFVNMRKFISNNALIFDKFEQIEQKLLKHDEKFDKIFKAIEEKDIKPKQGRDLILNF